jgi:hypothetical protein
MKAHPWIIIMGFVCGVTLIVGPFIELLFTGRWDPWPAVSGTGFAIVFAYLLFIERRRLRAPPSA